MQHEERTLKNSGDKITTLKYVFSHFNYGKMASVSEQDFKITIIN